MYHVLKMSSSAPPPELPIKKGKGNEGKGLMELYQTL
jgi:hypothetical protein